MAKGLRSSHKKANNTKLRSKVFGPVEDERKQRLSAKLLDLASKPKSKTEEDAKMVDGDEEPKLTREAEPEADMVPGEQGMDVDQLNDSTNGAESRSGRRGQIQKKGRSKAKAAMVFPVYKKGKRMGLHLSKRQKGRSLRP